MNCKKIKELIMTDYVDGEANSSLQRDIKEHLASCKDCRQFERTLQRTAIEPFKNAQKIQPPDIVWDRIKEAVGIKGPRREGILVDLKERMAAIFVVRRPAVSLAAAMILILLATIFTRPFFISPDPMADYVEDQVVFLSYLDTDTAGFFNGEGMDLGTAIEEYFL